MIHLGPNSCLIVQRIAKLNQVQFKTINEDHFEQRIDNYLLTLLKGVPKSHIYRILRKGEVRVNKKRVKAPYKLQVGDVVRIPPIKLPDKQEVELPNVKLDKVQQLESAILYESDNIIVMNKPSGMAVHGGSGLSFGVIEALRQLRPQARFLELVHRLDRDTSGCLLIAKKRSALRYLHEQLRDKKMHKKYVALVEGKWPKKIKLINAPLLKNTLKSGERVVKVDPQGKPSETRFAVREKFADTTLVECSPITGRTHQIRVHTLYAGCPIIGDTKYSTESTCHEFNKKFGFARLFLHAESITFKESKDSKKLTINAPFDESMESLLTQLRSTSE